MPLSEFAGATAFAAWLQEHQAELSPRFPPFPGRVTVESDEDWLSLLDTWFKHERAKREAAEAAISGAAAAGEGDDACAPS